MEPVAVQELYNQQLDGYGVNYMRKLGLMSSLAGYEFHTGNLDFKLMAEEESKTSSVHEAGSSSKDAQEEKDERWLQLCLGGSQVNLLDQTAEPIVAPSRSLEFNPLHSDDPKPLDPNDHLTKEFGVSALGTYSDYMDTSLLLQQPQSSLSFSPHEITWGYSPNSWNSTAPSSSFSSVPLRSYYPGPHQNQNIGSTRFRIIDAPQRPHSGIWFVLQVSQNQAKEPYLPQIPKRYLRIKDRRMTVKMLMKYLVNKLQLNDESEIEITCRAEKLLPFWTLQHVRDNIWSRRGGVPSFTDSSSCHVMILHYGRIA